MNALTKLYLLQHVVRWRLTWGRRNTGYAFRVPGNPKFMGPREAVKTLIPDGAVVATSGLAGNQRLSILYWAIRELFQETGHPRALTMLCTGGQGGRGKVPGTMEELGLEGLCARLITGHHETFKSLLKLAAAQKLELQCMPQGILTFLIDSQSRGQDSMLSTTGVGTCLDPRVGNGSTPFGTSADPLITVEGGQLRFRTPRINVAMFSAPAADREGNIYLKNTAMIAETFEIARAARANGGHVIANVGRIVDKACGPVGLRADEVDAVVYDRDCEQTASVKYRKHWPLFTTDSDMPVEEAIGRLRFINVALGVTPRRTRVDEAIARLAAVVFAERIRPGAFVNIGVGLPEEVCRVLFEAGLLKDVTVWTESGVVGGLPAPGVFFGAAACPQQMVSSAEVFRWCYEKLDVAILGVAEADSQGNVNVSKRSDSPADYVGPGGFVDITTSAKTILFITSWTAGGAAAAQNGRVRIVRRGRPKFIERVREVTFSGRHALDAGKNVFFATTVGLFHLTARGMELIAVMPGVDLERDVIQGCSMKVALPATGQVPQVDQEIVTGRGYRLQFESTRYALTRTGARAGSHP